MSRGSRLWPREHGAYAQLALPIISALALGSLNPAGLALAAAAVAGFLAHEPLLVLLGHRGWKRQEALRGPALLRLAMLGSAALVTGFLGVVFSDLSTRLALLPLVPCSLVLALLVARRREKTLAGELVVAVTFSLMAIPLALAAGASTQTALLLALLWSLLFALGTLAVHALLARSRARSRGPLLAWLAGGLGMLSAVLAVLLLLRGHVWAAACLPPAVVSGVVASGRIAVARLRQVGWVLAAAYILSFAVLMYSLQ